MWGSQLLFEESVKVPMIVRVPGVTKGEIHSGLVELVDLFPTLAELCSVTPPGNLQGSSFVHMLNDPDAPGKEFAYTVVRRGGNLGAAIRYDHYRYTEWGSPAQNELYDLTDDPHERINLAGKPECAPLVKKAGELLEKARINASVATSAE
jgi:arylsulfatase A-like enzyme